MTNNETDIDADDIERVLDCHEAEQDAPTLNDYFSAAAYSKTSLLEREDALIMMRHAWIKALSGPRKPGRRLTPSHARDYVLIETRPQANRRARIALWLQTGHHRFR